MSCAGEEGPNEKERIMHTTSIVLHHGHAMQFGIEDLPPLLQEAGFEEIELLDDHVLRIGFVRATERSAGAEADSLAPSRLLQPCRVEPVAGPLTSAPAHLSTTSRFPPLTCYRVPGEHCHGGSSQASPGACSRAGHDKAGD
jgi:hypothetical protein